MNISFTTICYPYKPLKDGRNRVMLRINMNGKRKYHSIGLAVFSSHWDFTKNQPKRSCPNRIDIQQIIRTKETALRDRIIELQASGNDFTLEDIFGDNKKRAQAKTVCEFYSNLIDQYKSKEQTGNARIHLDSYRSLKSFRNDKLNIPFSDISVHWLDKYEAWLRDKNCSETTMSVLFRTLRSAYNKAIEAGVADKKQYPFTAFKISKFDTSTNKRAITKEDVLKIMQVDLSEKREYVRLSRDIFIFSYLCGGINFTDIANLTRYNL